MHLDEKQILTDREQDKGGGRRGKRRAHPSHADLPEQSKVDPTFKGCPQRVNTFLVDI